MAHWSSRDQWFNRSVEHEHPGQSELWHGSRFRELSWYWNPDESYEEVFFRSIIPGVCEENDCPTLRLLPLLVTAD